MISVEIKQQKVFLYLSLSFVLISAILDYVDAGIFKRFFGEVNPILVVLLSSILGFIVLFYFRLKGWFTIYEKGQLKGVFNYVGWILLLASISILIDLKIIYSENMNIQFPESLLFYPLIGFFVEILFHVLPLGALLFLTAFIFKKEVSNKLVWVIFLIVAILEPSYQIYYMDSFPVWAMMAVWVNLFLFNTLQLFIFKRFGFISMYFARLVFYFIWHIVWGHFRLELLF